MGRLRIIGNKKLSGEILVSGSKNAALPIIFSTVITHGTSVLCGVPDIRDVRVAFEILRFLGATVEYDSGQAIINTEKQKQKCQKTLDFGRGDLNFLTL